MPYTLQPFASNNAVNANPLNQLGINPLSQYSGELVGAVEQAFLESLDFLVNEINSTFGTSLPDPSTIVSDLQGLFGGSGLIGNLLGSLTGGLTGSGGLLSGFGGGTSILSQLIGAGGGSGSTLGDFGSLLSGLGTDIEDVITDLTNPGALLSGFAGGSPILSQLPSLLTLPVTAIENLIDDATGNLFPNLFGSIPAANLTNVSIGNLTTAQSNMLSQPLFVSAASISPNSVFVWDGTQTATGATTPGSVTVSANSLTNTLLSNIVDVVAGDNITASIYTKWNALSYSGSNPIQLVARIYDANQNLIASPLLASVTTPGASSTWEQLTASYTIPVGGAFMCIGISILNTVVGGQVWFGNGMWSKVNQIPGGSVLGLSGLGSTVTGDLQGLVSTILGATGTPGSGPLGLGLISDVENALTNQPYTNIQGLLGPDNLGSALGATVDNIWQAVTGLFGTGNSLSTMSNALSNMAGNVSSATTISQNNSSTIANRAVTKPSYYGVDQSADVTFPFSQLAGATMPTIPITSAGSAIGMIGTPDGGVKESVMWIGSSTGTITGFYVNIYTLNTLNGVVNLTYASPDIHAAVPSAVATNYYNLPSANFITSSQTSFYAVEFAITGTGTYNMAGIVHNAPTNGNVYPKGLGASRVTSGGVTAPSSISTVSYSPNIPFCGLSGSAGVSEISSDTQEFLGGGTGQTFTVPSWMVAGNHFDVIVVGDGGGGYNTTTENKGGGAGAWATRSTLVYGVDVPLTTHTFTVNIGNGGAGAETFAESPGSGTGCSVVITGYGTISAAGGSGAGSSNANGSGPSPNPQTVNGLPYYAGGTQTAGQQPGIAPGGGGSAYNGSGGVSSGGNGAVGAAWIRCYQ